MRLILAKIEIPTNFNVNSKLVGKIFPLSAEGVLGFEFSILGRENI